MKDQTTSGPLALTIFLVSLTLASCGSSGTNTEVTPLLPTGISAVGQITGFGSVYVNGIEYDTTGASYDVDDVTASGDSALSVGMVVEVRGSVNADGRTGSASSIDYDDDIEGIVENHHGSSDLGQPLGSMFSHCSLSIGRRRRVCEHRQS